MAHGVLERAAAALPDPAPGLYGLIAEYEHAEDVVEAARKAREAGYQRMDAYSPFPVEGLDEAIGFRDVLVPLIMLAGGICGAMFGFGLLYYCMVISYPLNVGGQPLYSWPTYIPITFECTVLFSALSGAIGMFMLNGLPQPYHPVFDAPHFDQATSDRFFLCIEVTPNPEEDQRTEMFEVRDRGEKRLVPVSEVERFLASTRPLRVAPVPLRK